jgi:DNA-binding NarL/FixJ family response regulator
VIRVMLADDHPMVLAGIEELVTGADDMQVAAVARSGEEAVALAPAVRPDVVLMDLSMPGVGGIVATQCITASTPDTRVVMLSSYSDREGILDALDAGAIGYLLKDGEPEELISGIRTAHRGESPLAPKAAAAVLTRARKPEVELTDRETEVLRLIGAGLPNRRIASQLGIAEQTVKTHVGNIFHRLGVTDRTAAALWAQRNGMV